MTKISSTKKVSIGVLHYNEDDDEYVDYVFFFSHSQQHRGGDFEQEE